MMETLLKSVVQHLPTGLVLFEACHNSTGQVDDFRYLLTNPANALTMNRSVEEMTGKTLRELFPTIAKEDLYDRLLNVIETGVSQHYQHLYRGDGIEAWINATLVRVDDGVLFSFQDITALMQQNQELEMARKAAEEAHRVAQQALQVRDIFLANISHEIRTPLNSILGFSELLAEELADPEQLAYATNIKGAGHTLLKLINNVLDLAKLDANQFELESQPTSLAEVLGSVVNILGARSRQKNLEFTYSGETTLPPVVLSDALRLTQILMNLGENAVKFTREGRIKLLVDLTQKTEDKALVTFQVVDTGIGVPVHRLPLIFDRYQQTSAEITRRYGGTGLGLSIVQSLVQRMGGSITVESEVGVGTTFTVKIPFALPAVTPAIISPLAQLDTLMPSHSINVLLVEDNLYNQRVVENLTKRFNINLIKAGNGIEGLACLRRQSVDIVLMDLQMPLMDGYTTTRHIRQTMGLTVPIIAVTANALTHERENCLRAGMNDYLTKPFTRQELMLMIVQHSQLKVQPIVATGAKPVMSQLNADVLSDFYDGQWDLIEQQYDAFDTEWPQHCQLLTEALANHQVALFKEQAHKFCTTLDALGMTPAADSLRQLNQLIETDSPASLSQQMTQLIDNVEQAIVELKRYIEQGKIIA